MYERNNTSRTGSGPCFLYHWQLMKVRKEETNKKQTNKMDLGGMIGVLTVSVIGDVFFLWILSLFSSRNKQIGV